MTRRRQPAGWPQPWLSAALLLLVTGLSTGGALAQQPMLITGDPLPAEDLARMLYPLPSRSIVMKEPQATPFGFLIQFEFDSAQVQPESRAYLDEVGAMMNLRRLAGRKVQIVGHADASGTEAHNQSLSERRAHAVSQYLARYHGVELERLPVAGRGESDPIDPSDPFAARNRRVQFHPVH